MQKYDKIDFEIADGIATLTLNDPGTMNALSIPLQQEVRAALASIREDDSIRALLLTGTERAFSSGADLSSMQGAGAEDETLGQGVGRMMRELSNPLILDLQQLPVPVIAAVNGAAAGAGVSVALAADVVLAARSAYFLLTFLPRLGLVPDLGATWMLPRLIGRARAMGLALLGERLSAEKAVEWGLIWACVDDAALMDEAKAVATRLASAPRHAAQEARLAFAAADNSKLEEQLAYEALRQEQLADSAAFQEGVNAFLEKRQPKFE